MRKVFKYGTGDDVPEGAIYLCTKTETDTETIGETSLRGEIKRKENRYVWHYFLVEVEEK